MSGRVEGTVALATGAARGQGRSHALRLAEEGADVIAVDTCADLDTPAYEMGTEDELAETARLVEERDRRLVTAVGDVRDTARLREVGADGVATLGRLDIVCAGRYITGLELTVDPGLVIR